MNTQTKTTCPYCGVGCGIIATSHPDGTIAIKGDPEHPANFGRLCSKGSALGETLDLEGRLLTPMVDGVPGDWNTALDTVAQRFRAIIERHGPDAVAFYVSGQLLTEDYYVANKLMKGFIGSANIDTNSRLCMSSAVAAYKRAFGSDSVPCSYQDLELANLIILTGSNTAWCHPVIYQRIARAKKNNPRLRIVVIDPRRTATCDIADLHLPLRPGSDAFLFNGLLNFLEASGLRDAPFVARHTEGVDTALAAARASSPDIASTAQNCGLDVHDLTLFYELFANTERCVTLFSQGINQSSSGTDKGNAIINCHLLTGRIGRPGMGPFSMTGQPNAMGGREVGGLANQLAAHMDIENPEHRELVQTFWQSPSIANRPGLKAVDLFQAIEAGTVKAVWIMATNPVVSLPDAEQVKQALQKCDLVVVSDNMAHTDTMDLAHIKLPALGWGEKDGSVTNSERRISRQRAFLTSPGQSRPDWWIVSEVGKRLGYAEHFNYADSAAIFREHAQLSTCNNTATRDFDLGGLADMDTAAYDRLPPTQWPIKPGQTIGSERLFSDGHFFTPNGKARLLAIEPRAPRCVTSDTYPLVMNTGRVRDHWHTLTRTGKSPRLATHTQEPYAQLNPVDAVHHGIQENQLVEVSGNGQTILLRARVDSAQRIGSLFVPMHWNDQFSGQARVGALIPPHTDPISGQPESKHAAASIAPARARWYGFLLTRRSHIDLPGNTYWSRARGQGIWRYFTAGMETPRSWNEQARQWLCADDKAINWIEYHDSARQTYRAARLVDGKLESCLYVGATPQLPDHDWIEAYFARPELDNHERLTLLSGRPMDATADTGTTVCACFGVGSKTIRKAIREKHITTVEQITAELKAGGNCGSCLPELRELLEELQQEGASAVTAQGHT